MAGTLSDKKSKSSKVFKVSALSRIALKPRDVLPNRLKSIGLRSNALNPRVVW
jgi:hypothetical protein